MPTDSATPAPPSLAANDNAPGSRAMPIAVLMGLVDLLAEVGAARLAAANDNHPCPALMEDDE